MNFLTESASSVEFGKFFDRRNHDAKQLQNSQQSQKPQGAQVNRNKGLQEKRCYCQKVNDGKRAKDISHAGGVFLLEFFILRRQIKAQGIFQNKNSDRKNIKIMKLLLVGLIQGRYMFQHQSKQVENNQNADPSLER